MRRDERSMQRYRALLESGRPPMTLSDLVSATVMANYGEIAIRTISSHTKESEANASGLCNTDARRPSPMRAVARHSAPSGPLSPQCRRLLPDLHLGHRFQIFGNLQAAEEIEIVQGTQRASISLTSFPYGDRG
jgi:hypothetical protein